jgi:hypothetical protein
MTEDERKERPETTVRSRPGRPFQPKNPGKPKGALYHRTVVGMETARALSGKAVDVVEKLLEGRSPRVRLEAARTILAYAWGLPKQSIDITGGAFSEVASALADALKAAREARATALLEKTGPPALEASVIDAEPVEETPLAVPETSGRTVSSL